jgi:hypothetical protein
VVGIYHFEFKVKDIGWIWVSIIQEQIHGPWIQFEPNTLRFESHILVLDGIMFHLFRRKNMGLQYKWNPKHLGMTFTPWYLVDSKLVWIPY